MLNLGAVMRVEAKIQKWGNGLAIRIAGVMRDLPHFQEGSPVEVEVTEEGLTIKKLKKTNKSKLPFSESELLADINPATAHSELIAKPLKNEF